MAKKKTTTAVIARVLPDGGPIKIYGRDAWALECLHRAGPSGCTPLDHPGPRWSGYVFKLRKAGLIIETLTENHPAPFPGHHARYVLRSNIAIERLAESSEREAA